MSTVRITRGTGHARHTFSDLLGQLGGFMLGDVRMGDPMGFDVEFQEKLRGPQGTGSRRAHLVEQFADRLFGGDHTRAAKAMKAGYPELGGRSPHEIARTHLGMLEVKELVALKERNREEGARKCSVVVERRLREVFAPLLDLLPAAWGLTEPEFELLLSVPDGWLAKCRKGQTLVDKKVCLRLSRLLRFQEAYSLVARPHHLGSGWRNEWERGSPIGARSPWQAFLDDGDSALDRLELRFRALASKAWR